MKTKTLLLALVPLAAIAATLLKRNSSYKDLNIGSSIK